MSEPMRHSDHQSNQEPNHEFEYCLDDIFEPSKCDSDRAKRIGLTGEVSAPRESSANVAPESPRNEQPADRRKRRRALICAPVRVRGINVTDAVVDEISTTLDVSRAGILFLSSSPNYARGMEVAVIFPYSSAPAALHAEQPGRVVRAIEMSEGRYAVAVALGEGVGEDIVDACGRKLNNCSPPAQTASAPGATNAYSREPNSKRPLVLVVDAEESARAAMKSYLTCEGYDVMAASNCADAREVLNMFTPSLIIAEVEGEGLPGYDLCAHVKANPRLKHIPVMLTTSSGYPSDYSNAHSLGAVVCMTKPYKQERLGHVVRLLAPPPAELCSQKPQAARPADPSRKAGYGNCGQSKAQANGARRFRFPSFR